MKKRAASLLALLLLWTTLVGCGVDEIFGETPSSDDAKLQSLSYQATIPSPPGLTASRAAFSVLVYDTLTPSFNADLTSYTVASSGLPSSITVTATVSQPGATLTINGQAAQSGEPFVLTPGSLPFTITVVVRATAGNTKTYTIQVAAGPV